MCGIVGFINERHALKGRELESLVAAMADALRHRGPDDRGAWVDEHAGIALGHRRLSIIDLSANGHQPMVSADGRYVIVYNGEIYNFKQLREDLVAAGCSFTGDSDTEVMLAAIGRYGLEPALQKFNGMFAFALWDRSARVLYLCRDRLGEKPLYYGFIGRTFVFASELKAITAMPDFRREIDRDALALYFRYNCIPAPHSIYKDIKKVLPAEVLTFTPGTREMNSSFYWSALDAAGAFDPAAPLRDAAQVLEETESLLRDAVKARMVSDVPLGVFLSGGIDSSLITALMQAQSTTPVRTFTIGFGDPRYNEADDARKVAAYLKTQHTCFQVTPEDALKVIPDLPQIYDEPFADSSQIPTVLVSRLARRHVTVCLTGDAGDEIFAGYNRYVWLDRVWKKIGKVPCGMRLPLARLLGLCSSDGVDAALEKLKPVLPAKLQVRNPGIKFQKFVDCLASADADGAYTKLRSHWKRPHDLVLGHGGGSDVHEVPLPGNLRGDLVRRMMYSDMLDYLPNDILVKVDRAGMSASLESRAVYLDHRLVEYAWRLPTANLIGPGGSKLVLRRILAKYLPESYWDRPKMGFAVPIDAWLRGPLREWAEALLSETAVRRQGFLDPKIVAAAWQGHVSGKRNAQFELWDILMFNAWLAS